MFICYHYDPELNEWDIWEDNDFPAQYFTQWHCNECHWMVPGFVI